MAEQKRIDFIDIAKALGMIARCRLSVRYRVLFLCILHCALFCAVRLYL